ncbi:ANR family transcriptional regulator [Serratia liquefaciens]|uniref:ANR family transcriptional regulator n=1 Tax=Serratia liquefaciens TaxID=614 RepID=UPI00165D10E8|nr:ANR family transcriptional regulator [Serratia liquefaciens]QNQ52342.1 ANR family transcriptional regulator [Serratia liquefaciens]
MTFGYKNLAHQAAEAERSAQYGDAASIWLKAFEVARAVDVMWVQIRIDFCVNAASRNWGR